MCLDSMRLCFEYLSVYAFAHLQIGAPLTFLRLCYELASVVSITMSKCLPTFITVPLIESPMMYLSLFFRQLPSHGLE